MSTQCPRKHPPVSSCCKARSTCSSSELCWPDLLTDAIAEHIQRTSEDLPQIETGSLYPALHRLEANGWLSPSWEPVGERQAGPLLSAHTARTETSRCRTLQVGSLLPRTGFDSQLN